MRNKYVLKDGEYLAFKYDGNVEKLFNFFEGLFTKESLRSITEAGDWAIKRIRAKTKKNELGLLGEMLFKNLFKQAR